MRAVEAVLLLVVRVALGAMFVFAAWMKLKNPQAFADSVLAFKIFGQADHLVVLTTFVVPWLEMICGVLLLLGLWSRAAALSLFVQLLIFTGGIISVLYRKLDVSCGCFGEYEWPCKGPVSICHVGRNTVLLLAMGLLVWRGGGVIGLDGLRWRRRGRVDAGAHARAEVAGAG